MGEWVRGGCDDRVPVIPRDLGYRVAQLYEAFPHFGDRTAGRRVHFDLGAEEFRPDFLAQFVLALRQKGCRRFGHHVPRFGIDEKIFFFHADGERRFW